ncbi:MAG: hypothetical protein K9G13_07020 [Aquiluna sp.]|nr:hypothetical protein [Aquiluna sp.]MCF8546270.1 hypothetical protein [Aquiluna sp.]
MRIAIRIQIALLVLGFVFASWVFVPQLYESRTIAQNEATETSVDPANLQLVCPGAFVQVGGSDGTYLGAIERLPSAIVNYHSTADSLLSEPEATLIDFGLFEVQSSDQSTDLLNANQLQEVATSRASGLAGIDCSMPKAAGWFVGAEASVGTESVLILSNPNPTEVTISLEFIAPSGATQDQVTLASGETKLLPLAKYVVADEAFAVRFESNSSEVSATMQSRNTSGLTATGVELSGAIAEPLLQSFFPGAKDLTGGYQLPILRVFNPGDVTASVEVFAQGAGPETSLGVHELEAGEIASIDLEVPIDATGVAVVSTQPVLTAVKNFVVQPKLDFAWILPAQEFSELAVIASPAENSVLSLANPNSSPVNVTIQAGQVYQTFELGVGMMLDAEVPKGSARILSSGKFVANLSVFADAGYSVLTPGNNQNLGSNLEILVR